MSDVLSTKLIEEIQKAVEVKELKLGGRNYTTQKVYPVEIIAPDALKFRTLQGVIDYLTNKLDGSEKGFVHVATPDTVFVYRELTDFNRRERLVEAGYTAPDFQFGKQYEQDVFLTKLQTSFVADDERKRLQEFVAKLFEESSTHLQDDGVSQTTATKSGVQLSREGFQNPIILKPFRTFSDVEQPGTECVLRLHRQKDEVPTISLHEADNGFWQQTAIENVKEFLIAHLQGLNIPVLA